MLISTEHQHQHQQRDEPPAGPSNQGRRGSLQGLFDSLQIKIIGSSSSHAGPDRSALNMSSSSSSSRRISKPLPLPPPSPPHSPTEELDEMKNIIPPTPLTKKGGQQQQHNLKATQHQLSMTSAPVALAPSSSSSTTAMDVKRICLPDEKNVLILHPLFNINGSANPGSSSSSNNTGSAWQRVETTDDQGRSEIFFYNSVLQKKLRGCCNESKNIVSCCALCEHDDWIFQGSEYDSAITRLYARNDGCLPSTVRLVNPKFIIPWRYKNRRTSAVSWKVIHMCGAQMEDAECETIVVNAFRDKKLKRLIEAVRVEGPWYNGAERVEYLLRVVRLALGDYGLPGGATSSQADASLFAQMKQQGHNFMFLCSVRIGLCRHKALLFKILCDVAGLDCALVTGYSTGGRHQWNIISLYDPKEEKSNSYIIDPTSPHFTWAKQGSARMKAYKITQESSFGHGGLTLLQNMRTEGRG